MPEMRLHLFVQGGALMDRRNALILIGSAACSLACGCMPTHPSQGAFLSVDPDLCVGCRKCIAVCNYDAITFISNKAVIDPSKCNPKQCGKCFQICPKDAIN
jgi:heterodisulfide reductase subunit A-like polyferredoxin